MKTKTFFSALLIFILLAYTQEAMAQTEQELKATILHLDSAFWKSYNSCDTAQFKKFITADVEFYHDKGGITNGAAALTESVTKNLCSNKNFRLRREAVAGTVKVYPLKKDNEVYGAVITGEHVFYINDGDKPEFLDGQANFTHLWLLQNGEWKMKRILSFNHHAAAYINKRKETSLTDKQLDELTGNYKSDKSGVMNLVKQGNVLLLKSEDNTYTLYPQDAASFFSKERDLVFEFEKDADNKPIKMIVKEHGAVADELLFEKK